MHLSATGGLADVTIPVTASNAGRPLAARTPLLPLTIDGARMPLRRGPPALGADNLELLKALGYRDDDIAALRDSGIVANAPEGRPRPTEAASG